MTSAWIIFATSWLEPCSQWPLLGICQVNTVFSLADADHVTWLLASDWTIVVTWPEEATDDCLSNDRHSLKIQTYYRIHYLHDKWRYCSSCEIVQWCCCVHFCCRKNIWNNTIDNYCRVRSARRKCIRWKKTNIRHVPRVSGRMRSHITLSSEHGAAIIISSEMDWWQWDYNLAGTKPWREESANIERFVRAQMSVSLLGVTVQCHPYPYFSILFDFTLI